MATGFKTATSLLGRGDDAFNVTVLQADADVGCVLFAAGLGGNPARHLGLLQTIAAYGFSVVAPHFEMLASSVPTKAELIARIRRLDLAMNEYCSPGLPVSGVGHSIGTVALLVLAGAEASTLAGDRLAFEAERTLERLVLLAPPTDFFRRSGSLASVHTPMQIWAGGKDTITPPAQAHFLKETLGSQTQIDLQLVEDAGHFSFMNELPPHVSDPHPDRDAFIQRLGVEASRFLSV
jgi:pimeloyl-ACP methyl ester carboxylesterase